MPLSHIVPFRKAVTDLLRGAVTPPVYGYLPDDVAHLPVLVVGRPTIRESGTPTIMTMSLDVTLLARRTSDEDAQAEVDALADETFDVLGWTRGVKVMETHLLRTDSMRPGTVLVAGNEIPAYLFTLSLDIATC